MENKIVKLEYKKQDLVVAVDIETTGLDFLEDRIRLISAYSSDTALVTEDILELKAMLEDPVILKVFHNAPFDVSFLQANGIFVKNYTDTLIMAQVAENKARGEGRSLSYLSEKYLGIYMDKSLQNEANWWLEEITPKHKEYALKDAEITFKLYKTLMGLIEEKNLHNVLKREIGALPIIAHLKINGMKFDFDGWMKILDGMAKETKALKLTIQKLTGNNELNLESPAQLLSALRSQEIPVTATNDEELKKYEADYELVALIRKYKKNKKNIIAFGTKLASGIGKDGRLRGNWSLIGTDTGRMSCSNPPMQAMPRASRPYFKEEKGNSLVLADYQTIEIRILAAISKDPELLKAIRRGEDLHKKTASGIFNKDATEISEVERGVGKILNFGIIYGMSSWGVKKKVSSSIGQDIRLVEAEKYRQDYFKLYKGVLSYQEAMLKACYVRTLGQRSWYGDELEQGSVKRYNYPIQSAMSDGLKEALIILLRILEEKKSWKVVSIIHDEIIMEVPDADIPMAKVVLEEAMIYGMNKLVEGTVAIGVNSDVRKAWEQAS